MSTSLAHAFAIPPAVSHRPMLSVTDPRRQGLRQWGRLLALLTCIGFAGCGGAGGGATAATAGAAATPITVSASAPSPTPSSNPVPPDTLRPADCGSGPWGAQDWTAIRVNPIDGARPSDDFNASLSAAGNVEGVVWWQGAVYLSEFGAGEAFPPPSRVVKYTEAAGATLAWAAEVAGTNGLAIDAGGRLVGASHRIGGLVRFPEAEGNAPSVIVDRYQGVRFNSPNDLAVRRDGSIYFTDPTWQAPRPFPQAQARVYRVSPDGGTVTVLLSDRPQPNGVTFSLDEKTLYLTALDGLWAYPVLSDGSLGAGSRWSERITQGDGMVLDCAGNLYVTTPEGVAVLSERGNWLTQITLPNRQAIATNVAFGGADRRTLFITAMGPGGSRGLYSARLTVPGLPY